MDTFNHTPDLPNLDPSSSATVTDNNAIFYQHHSPGTWFSNPHPAATATSRIDLSDSQKDFLKFESQRQRMQDDAKSLRIDQLTSENEQLKTIIGQMRQEIETIRERTGTVSNAQQAAQTIYELRRELYKVQAEKKSVELEKEYLEQQSKEAKIDGEMFKAMQEKESELYECKIKMIQKENEIIMLNQK